MNPWENDYQQTKLVKQGAVAMPPTFCELAEWIGRRFDVPVPLNIFYDRSEPLHGPRLQVIFEHKLIADDFRIDRVLNFDPVKQAEVKARYLQLLGDGVMAANDAERLFVIFSAFEPAARWEANSRMTPGRINDVLKLLSSTVIWKIHPGFGCAIIFVHTDAQLKMTEGGNFRDRCRNAYTAILGQFDDFGYFQEHPIELTFDSRENFEAKYNGSWFAYDR